jgi:hypothetical protein
MTKLRASVVAVALLFLPFQGSISSDMPEPTSLGIEVPGSVLGVIWNPGSDRFCAVMQIIYIPVKGGKAGQSPKTQVWLLKPDGSVISPSGPPGTGSISGPGIEYHLGYRYAHAEAREAVAAAIEIEGQYFIKALPAAGKGAP